MANRIKDDSGDRTYWVQTPLLVWALSQDPYDLALWFTIKAIAGEDRECILSTEDLAALSMMSVGKVSQCRARLIDLGLLEGEVRRDPEYPQPVWHLTIPDIWETNVKWAKTHKTIRAKVDHKSLQRSETSERKKSLHQVKEVTVEPSPHEGGTSPHEGGTSPHEGGTSPHEGGTSPGEGGTSPGEGGTSPGEANKIIYRSDQDPTNNSQDPRVNPPPPILVTSNGGGGGLPTHANGYLNNSLNGNGQHAASGDSSALRSENSLSARSLATEWAADFAAGWASLEDDLNVWTDDQVYCVLTWLYVWAVEVDSQDRALTPVTRYDASRRYTQYYANVYAGATNRIGLIKSKVKAGIAVPLTEDDARSLDLAIQEGIINHAA